jgi:hypothetical protein
LRQFKVAADPSLIDRLPKQSVTIYDRGSLSHMATRQERIDEFDHEGSPPHDRPLQILCEDHVGTYIIPFLCQWSEGAWQNAETRRPIEVAVIGWREPKRNQR